jgi:hypothetical protein
MVSEKLDNTFIKHFKTYYTMTNMQKPLTKAVSGAAASGNIHSVFYVEFSL